MAGPEAKLTTLVQQPDITILFLHLYLPSAADNLLKGFCKEWYLPELFLVLMLTPTC